MPEPEAELKIKTLCLCCGAHLQDKGCAVCSEDGLTRRPCTAHAPRAYCNSAEFGMLSTRNEAI